MSCVPVVPNANWSAATTSSPAVLPSVDEVEQTAVAMYCNGEKRPTDLQRFHFLASESGLPVAQQVIATSEVPVAIFMCSQALKLYLKTVSPPPSSPASLESNPPRGAIDDPFAARLRNIKGFLEEAIVLRYQQQQHSSMYHIKGLLDCFALVIRAGLLDVPEFSNVAVDILRGFGMETHQLFGSDGDVSLAPVVPNKLAVLLLDTLVQSIGHVNEKQSLAEHRRISAHFKETCLDDIFFVSMSCLFALHLERQGSSRQPSFAQDPGLIEATVGLARSVLCFDFIGLLGMDGSDVNEEPASMNYPASWRRVCLDPQLFPFVWDLFTALSGTASVAVREALLRCINCLCCIRRSFFQNDEERRRWLGLVLQGTMHVMEKTSTWLQEPRLCAEFCRLLCRIKPNFQLNELLEDANYERWLAMVTDFTCSALLNWSYTSPSLGYLCLFWSRLVGSQQYAKKEKLTHFDVAVPRVVQAFVRSRVDMADAFFPAAVSDAGSPRTSPRHAQQQQRTQQQRGEFGSDNPLNDATSEFISQLDCIANLLRVCLQQMVGDVAKLFRDNANHYSTAISQRRPPSGAVEEQLAWLAFLFGSLMKVPTTSDEDFDADASIITSMFQLMELMIQRYSIRPSVPSAASQWTIGSGSPTEHLELATLHFLHHFRNVYVGETTNQANRTLSRLQERLGFGALKTGDMQGRLLEFMLSKIVSNLQAWSVDMSTVQAGGGNGLGGEDGEGGSQTNVLGETLRLLRDLSCGFVSGRQLLDLPTVRRLLSPQGAQDFSFQRHARLYRLRVRYRHTTTTLLFLESGINQRQMLLYMSPFVGVLDELRRRYDEAAAATSSGSAMQGMAIFLQEPAIHDAVVGALCDLRGVATACIGRRNFHMYFESMFPRHFETLLAIATTASSEKMIIQLLRITFEVCHNRCQRIHFDPHSAGGFQLFFFAAEVVQALGSRILDWVVTTIFGGGQLDLGQASLSLAALLGGSSQRTMEARSASSSSSFTVGDHYLWLVKGSQLILAVAHCALSGAYCNFGVLAMYQDTKLSSLLGTVWQFLQLLPLEVLVGAPKLANVYFSLAAEIFTLHVDFLQSRCRVLDVLRVLSVLEGGLQATALPAAAVTAAYTAIGSLGKHIVEGRWATRQDDDAAGSSVSHEVSSPRSVLTPIAVTYATSLEVMLLQEDPQLLVRWTVLTFKNLLIDDGTSLFRYSEALLPLTWHMRLMTTSGDVGAFPHGLAVLLSRGSQRPADACKEWTLLLSKLCDGVEENLERKSRDKFLQQLTLFKNSSKNMNW
jgi:exportin-7